MTMTSHELIPETSLAPLGIGVEMLPCYVCGESLSHFEMTRLRVDVHYSDQRANEHMGQAKTIYLCPACKQQGRRFALAPLTATVRMTPGGRNAKAA